MTNTRTLFGQEQVQLLEKSELPLVISFVPTSKYVKWCTMGYSLGLHQQWCPAVN